MRESFIESSQTVEKSSHKHTEPRVFGGSLDFPIHRRSRERNKLCFHFHRNLWGAGYRYGGFHRLFGHFLSTDGFSRERLFIEFEIFVDVLLRRFKPLDKSLRHSYRAYVQKVHASYERHE